MGEKGSASKEKKRVISPRFGPGSIQKESSKKAQSPQKAQKQVEKKNDEEILFGDSSKSASRQAQISVNLQDPIPKKTCAPTVQTKLDQPSQFIFKQTVVFDRDQIHDDLK